MVILILRAPNSSHTHVPQESIPTSQQILLFKGRALVDEEEVGTLGIGDDDVLKCIDVGPRSIAASSNSSSLLKPQMLQLYVKVWNLNG
jgi:hypothetical protein